MNISQITEEEYNKVCDEYEKAVLEKEIIDNSLEWKDAISDYSLKLFFKY